MWEEAEVLFLSKEIQKFKEPDQFYINIGIQNLPFLKAGIKTVLKIIPNLAEAF